MNNKLLKRIFFTVVSLLLLWGILQGGAYVYDHRPCDNLSGYCNIDFRSVVNSDNNVSATLSIQDYRFNESKLINGLVMICDGTSFHIRCSVDQIPASYASSSFQTVNRLFAEFSPVEAEAIKKADCIVIQFEYENGDIISLPLSNPDKAYWKNQLR